jgi:hypothetical protein
VWATDSVWEKESSATLVSPAGTVVATAKGMPYRFELDLDLAAGTLKVSNVSTRKQAMKKWTLVADKEVGTASASASCSLSSASSLCVSA